MKETLRTQRGHAFLPDASVLTQVPALYATDGVPLPEKMVWARYFCGPATWYLMELNPDGSLAFGWADLGDPQNAELGYFDLEELEELYVPLVVGIAALVERDVCWQPMPFGEVHRH